MSQKSTRKSQTAAAVGEEKEKRQADSPVKEMKKKLAANAEKEKQAAEKVEKLADKNDKAADKTDKTADKNEKHADKNDKTANKNEKPTDKNDKTANKNEKPTDKNDKTANKNEKSADKNDKSADKTDKSADKSVKVADKSGEKKSEKVDKSEEKKADKPAEKKPEQAEKKEDSKADKIAKDKPKTNGTNGVEPTTNGAEDANGTVSDESDCELVIEEDEQFPELAYDESDTDAFESDLPSRSLTRRSQVKVTKTPETPRPISEKEGDDSKESKILKLSDTPASDRKLRSANSPKPESKKTQDKKALDSPKTDSVKIQDSPKKQEEKDSKKDDESEKAKDGKSERADKLEVEFVVEVEGAEGEPRRSRARVSPYSRPGRAQPRLDTTVSSVTANYTGNNTTMEMDITESSSFSMVEEPALDDSGYLRGLRAIRGRTSYKPLGEMKLTHAAHRSARHTATASTSTLAESQARPTAPVVGRKRKPSSDDVIETAVEATDDVFAAHGKRMRLLDRLAMPFRRNITSRRAAEIVGINTDLPLTAPVASTSSFDPETLKPVAEPGAAPLPPAPAAGAGREDSKRCVVM